MTRADPSRSFNSQNPLAVESWRLWGSWEPYRFNYDGSASPAVGEMNTITNKLLGFAHIDRFICYAFAPEETELANLDYNTIDEPIFILALSTTNAAHSICELMSFINFYQDVGSTLKVGVNTIIQTNLPFLFQLLTIFIPANRIISLDADKRYMVRKGWVRRNTHFNFITNWNEIPYQQVDNIIFFNDLQPSTMRFLEDPSFLMNRCATVYQSYRGNASLRHDRIMLVKTRKDAMTTTPDRAMTMSDHAAKLLARHDIKVVSVDEFQSVEEYIYTLRGARVFITSYGGAACTNRFFLDPECRVVLLANKHYKSEYEYPSDNGKYWHIRHSHLFPVKQQIIILDHENEFTDINIEQIAMHSR